MPALLPGGWKGGATLLVIVFMLSSFLDNIAGAIIGGTVPQSLLRRMRAALAAWSATPQLR